MLAFKAGGTAPLVSEGVTTLGLPALTWTGPLGWGHSEGRDARQGYRLGLSNSYRLTVPGYLPSGDAGERSLILGPGNYLPG